MGMNKSSTSSDLQILPNENSRASSISSSLSTSQSPTNNVFARYRYENARKVKPKKISSKQERDSDSEYDPMEDTTTSSKKKKQKKKKSMKEEASSSDEDEQMNDSNSITPKRQLFKAPKRQLSMSKSSKSKTKKDEKWKTKTFYPLKIKYSIQSKKSEY